MVRFITCLLVLMEKKVTYYIDLQTPGFADPDDKEITSLEEAINRMNRFRELKYPAVIVKVTREWLKFNK